MNRLPAAALRSIAVATVAVSLAACTTTSRPRPTDGWQQARDAQRQLLSSTGLENHFKQPLVDGKPTVTTGRDARFDTLNISYDPRYVTQEEINQAGTRFCEKQKQGRQATLLEMTAGQVDESSRVVREQIQRVGSATFFCTNGSAADESLLAGYKGSRTTALQQEAQRSAMQRSAQLRARIEESQENRARWEAIKRRDEQRVNGATGYDYVPTP
ncbi:hypothetical protein HUE56_29950 (plasmid) [Azospirillum oryzae]|uniref:Lipoprotein n=1 Tax=Azospirillum oryzae TaxID=286727 RepID=A0A6N1AU13_9PROT|nr:MULTISPECIES: hypothetical protein [Azospirillum]KAA0584699.1 hypothetical protein FZ938_28315 [Azospirillum oryzae]QCG99271.1 hypothetical protein E6C67_36395 [Azospirillum sp. TSA2s]QKS54728.1 hypothetical protein HUE56_29950 [Azospirillum oryzae]